MIAHPVNLAATIASFYGPLRSVKLDRIFLFFGNSNSSNYCAQSMAQRTEISTLGRLVIDFATNH